jgi:hypothetical protein
MLQQRGDSNHSSAIADPFSAGRAVDGIPILLERRPWQRALTGEDSASSRVSFGTERCLSMVIL